MTTGSDSPTPRRFGLGWIAVLVTGLFGVALFLVRVLVPEPVAAQAERLLDRARERKAAGDWAGAEEAASRALEQSPQLAAAAFVAAESAVRRERIEQAVGYLNRVVSTDARLAFRRHLMAAELLHHRLHRLGDAEQEYSRALGVAPGEQRATTGMAALLALCGRKREVIPYALKLIELDVDTDLLILLSSDDAVVNDVAALTAAHATDPNDPNPMIGLAWHAAQHDRLEEGLSLLREATRRAPDHLPAQIALGKLLLSAEQFVELADWERRLPKEASGSPDVWSVRARMAEQAGNSRGAIRCYWESARLAPEIRSTCAHLSRLLQEEHQAEAAEPFLRYLQRLNELESAQNRVLFARDQTAPPPLMELVSCYQRVGRLWEACGWCRIAVNNDRDDLQALKLLEQLLVHVRSLPLKLVADEANVALAMDLSNYPLPQFPAQESAAKAGSQGPMSHATFRADTESVQFEFQYFNGTNGQPARRMFEFTGGGVGVLDFDLDGYPDLFLTQGRPWEATDRQSLGPDADRYSDRLFRNRSGQSFAEVAALARIEEVGFGQGVTIGDFDADGFSDVYVGNIGPNQLWRNCGDGTFEEVTNAAGVAGTEWTTSCLMADLNGDQLPDIYAANYLTAPDIYTRICRDAAGQPQLCMPADFYGQRDQVWLNDGDGHFTDATSQLSIEPTGAGLGLAAFDAQRQGRLSLYIANDATPNFFFLNDSSPERWNLRECGMELGIALNEDGKATGSMGIAVGDVNDDGLMDLVITNFLGEGSTFYQSRDTAAYDDRTRSSGLPARSVLHLGFGTQFLDADCDGSLELFVTNGHVDDLRSSGKLYRMPPQLFHWSGEKFVEIEGASIGPYFKSDWLGRAVARVDWNRDGREDFVVGHLDDPSVILTNTTEPSGHRMSLRFCGVQSNRDAIGTRVEATFAGRTIHRQLTAGDGYQASNQRLITIGIGTANEVERLTIHWPSGQVQRFEEISADGEYLLREGGSLLRMPREESDRVSAASESRP